MMQSFYNNSLYLAVLAILSCVIYFFFFYDSHKFDKLTTDLDKALAEKRELEAKYTELQAKYLKSLIETKELTGEVKKFVVEYREDEAKQKQIADQCRKMIADLKADVKEEMDQTVGESDRTIKQLAEIIKSKDAVIEMYREMLDECHKVAADMKTAEDLMETLKKGPAAAKE